MKNSFFSDLLKSIINGAAKTAAAAGDGGADLKTTGYATGAGALAGALGYILAHPLGQHSSVQAVSTGIAPPASVSQ